MYVCRPQGNKEVDEEMKFGKLRTLRGQIEVTGGGVARKNIIASDGLINFGLRIKSFVLWPAAISAASTVYTSILSLDTIPSGSLPNAGDNRQFAWVESDAFTNNVWPPINVIDPDHIVNRDLFISMVGAGTGVYNYLIEAQVVELTDDEAIVTIIKETSQS